MHKVPYLRTRHRSSGTWHDDNTSDLWDTCCHFVSLLLPARSALEADQRKHIIHLPLESTFIHQRPPLQHMAAVRTGSGLGERAVTDRWHSWWHRRLDMCVCLLWTGRGRRGRDHDVRVRAMEQVPASLRWLFWCLRFRQGVTRRSRELREQREKKQKKREGFGVCRQAYLLPRKEDPKGTMGVSHDRDEPGPDIRPVRALRSPEPHGLSVASTSNTFTFFWLLFPLRMMFVWAGADCGPLQRACFSHEFVGGSYRESVLSMWLNRVCASRGVDNATGTRRSPWLSPL